MGVKNCPRGKNCPSARTPSAQYSKNNSATGATIHKRVDVCKRSRREHLHTPIRLRIVALVAELSLLEDRHWGGTFPGTRFQGAARTPRSSQRFLIKLSLPPSLSPSLPPSRVTRRGVVLTYLLSLVRVLVVLLSVTHTATRTVTHTHTQTQLHTHTTIEVECTRACKLHMRTFMSTL